jgi:hypothetical protein
MFELTRQKGDQATRSRVVKGYTAAQASQVIALLIAKSQTRNKHNKETPKGGSVYSEREMLFPV